MELEKRIFDYLRLRPKQISQQFSSELVVLLNGYYLIGISLRQLNYYQSQLDPQKLQEISNKNSKQFFENGYKLANKYLGNDHYFSKLFFELKQEEYDDFLQNDVSDDNNNFDNNFNNNNNIQYDVEKYLVEPKRKLNFNRENLSHYHFRREQQQRQFDDQNFSAQGIREQKDFRINSPKQFEFLTSRQQQQQRQDSENNSLQFEQSQQIQNLVSQVKLLENSMNLMQSQLTLQKENEQQQLIQQQKENANKNIAQTPTSSQQQQQKQEEYNQMQQMMRDMQKKLEELEQKNKNLVDSQSRQKEQFIQYEKKIETINSELQQKDKIINQQQQQNALQSHLSQSQQQQQLQSSLHSQKHKQQQQQQPQQQQQQQLQQQQPQQQQQQPQQQQLTASQTQVRGIKPPRKSIDRQIQMQMQGSPRDSNGNFSQLEDEEGDYFEEASLNQQEIMNQKNFFNLKDFLLLPKEVICQQRVCYDNVFYKLICKLFVEENKNNRKLQIQIINEEMNKCFYQDILELEIISNIVKLINYQDILPAEISLKTITSFPQFCRYCIMPFLALKPNENKLEIWPKAIGLNPPIDRLFMKEEVFVQFHHIQNSTFRIILSEKKKFCFCFLLLFFESGFSFFFDICLEETSLKGLLFPIDVKYRKNQFIQTLGQQTDTFDSNEKFTQLYKDYKLPNEYYYDSYKILNTTLLDENLGKIIDEIDEFLTIIKGYNTLTEFLVDKAFKVIRVKVWKEFSRFRIYYVKERVELQCFEVNLRNSFQTFAIQNEKIKAFGQIEYPFSKIWQQFGIQYNKMDQDDKKLICNLITDLYSLDVHEKKLDDEDYDRYEENPILPIQLESGGYSRTFVGETYKFPVTISVIGINDIVMGVKMTLFDIETSEEHGMFFSINQEFWERAQKDDAPKKKKKYQIMNPIDEKYYIVQAVKKYGWRLLMNFATFQNQTNKSEIEGRKTGNGYTIIEQIENVFEGQNIQNLIIQ